MAVSLCPRAVSLSHSSLWPHLPGAGFRGWGGPGASLSPGSWGQEQCLQNLVLGMLGALHRRLWHSGVALQSRWGKGGSGHIFWGSRCMIVPCLLGLSAPTLPWLLDTLGYHHHHQVGVPGPKWNGCLSDSGLALPSTSSGPSGRCCLEPVVRLLLLIPPPAQCRPASLRFQLRLLPTRGPGGLAWRDSGQALPSPPRDTGAAGLAVACRIERKNGGKSQVLIGTAPAKCQAL